MYSKHFQFNGKVHKLAFLSCFPFDLVMMSIGILGLGCTSPLLFPFVCYLWICILCQFALLTFYSFS